MSLTDIYEAYCENVAIQEAERQKEMKKKMAAHILKKKSSDDVENFSFTQDQRKYNLLNISKTSEKIISFNETEAIAQGKKNNISSLFKDTLKHYKVLSVSPLMFSIFFGIRTTLRMKYLYETMFVNLSIYY